MTAVVERTVPTLPTIREVKAGSFIFERPSALPPAFCDAVIERFEAQPEYQYAGRVGQLRTEDPRKILVGRMSEA